MSSALQRCILIGRTFYPLLLKSRVGKSFLARQLALSITERNDSSHLSRFQVLNLEFDILESSKDQWDEHSFASSRDQNIAQLEALIQQPTPNELHKLIVVDDIMYLHSMRRAIYVIARDLEVHHLFVVRVVADYATALTRNSIRPDSKRVSEETLLKIFNRFEEPNHNLVHERNSFIVDTASVESSNTGLAIILTAIEESLSEYDPTSEAVKTGQKKDVVASRSAVQEEGNIISLIDLELRKVTSSLVTKMARLDSLAQTPKTRKMISKLLSDTKAAVLEIAREDKNRIKNKQKMTNCSAKNSAIGSMNAVELSSHTSGGNESGTTGAPLITHDYTVSPVSPEVESLSLLMFDTSHYSSLFSSILRSRVEELLLHMNSSNPAAKHSAFKSISPASCFAEQYAFNEILCISLTSLHLSLAQI